MIGAMVILGRRKAPPMARRRRWREWFASLAFVAVAVLAADFVARFSGDEIQVDPAANQLYVVRFSWWGLSEERASLRWRKERNHKGEVIEAWHYSDNNGRWLPAFLWHEHR